MRIGHLYGDVQRVLYLQGQIAVVAGVVFWLKGGFDAAYSAGMGALSAIIPGTVFALLSGRFNPAQRPEKLIRRFYLAEATKLLLTAVMFYIVFNWQKPEFLPLMVTYVAVLGAYWFALLKSN